MFLEKFRSHVVGCPLLGSFVFLRNEIYQLACHAEIAEFKNSIFVHEDVARLEVTINNAARVQILQALHEILDKTTDHIFGKLKLVFLLFLIY